MEENILTQVRGRSQKTGWKVGGGAWVLTYFMTTADLFHYPISYILSSYINSSALGHARSE